MVQVTPVLLCGGSGTRLWPLSRKSFPKQFTAIQQDETLFQASALRLHGQTGDAVFAPPLIVTASDFRFIVTEQLTAVGIDPGAILIEPEGRNTAPAVLAAALHAQAEDPDAILLVAPSDHVIPETTAFRAAVDRGLEAVAAGRIVTFGITPDRAETGYGYLELAEAPDGSGRPAALSRFVEKPDVATAQRMIEAGNFLWNAGIFMFAAKDILTAYDTHAPTLVPPVRAAVQEARSDLGFLRLDPEAWSRVEDISVDYAVMEKAPNLSAVPFGGAWSDLGSWTAVHRESPRDDAGVAVSEHAHAIDCTETLLRCESAEMELVGIGLKSIVAVVTSDAVLVADADRTQDVKAAVSLLKERGLRQAEAFAMDHRPWGHFETLALADRFQVKRIVVKPGAALSLQSHVHRAEHWVVVSGTARVTVGETVTLLSENQSVYVPLGEKHRLENPGKVPMILIEVQTGSYLGEDDIIRYEDVYAREAQP
ncbi:mannose-1-phosphate guanylyltransferase/mannose-6-phosphate isomerase [Roseovarius aestuariivivens]|uniref:mannose-1-phosphate guanylyltransferase/mannose-6-phosphate isomerase n=1 Tax=Roseovarius aestuariivivens TaxID=1888910 RepID=UPI0010808892|nr:mannose-1-phosphate guanylyltransferase/mannose-6-phosphate isomerase [Roseovarius aestuariivivens]